MACNDGWVRFNTPRLVGDIVAAVFRLEWDGVVACIRQLTDAKFVVQSYRNMKYLGDKFCAEDHLIREIKPMYEDLGLDLWK